MQRQSGRHRKLSAIFFCLCLVFSLTSLNFLCCYATDPQIAVPATTPSTSAFYKFGNDSYKLLTQKMKWDEARRQCQADDGDLASILDTGTQAFITLQMHKHNEPVWIGLNNNVVGLSRGLLEQQVETV